MEAKLAVLGDSSSGNGALSAAQVRRAAPCKMGLCGAVLRCRLRMLQRCSALHRSMHHTPPMPSHAADRAATPSRRRRSWRRTLPGSAAALRLWSASSSNSSPAAAAPPATGPARAGARARRACGSSWRRVPLGLGGWELGWGRAGCSRAGAAGLGWACSCATLRNLLGAHPLLQLLSGLACRPLSFPSLSSPPLRRFPARSRRCLWRMPCCRRPRRSWGRSWRWRGRMPRACASCAPSWRPSGATWRRRGSCRWEPGLAWELFSQEGSRLWRLACQSVVFCFQPHPCPRAPLPSTPRTNTAAPPTHCAPAAGRGAAAGDGHGQEGGGSRGQDATGACVRLLCVRVG